MCVVSSTKPDKEKTRDQITKQYFYQKIKLLNNKDQAYEPHNAINK